MLTEWIVAAALVPVVGASALWCGRMIARGFGKLVRTGTSETIIEIVTPLITTMSASLNANINALRETNHREHTEVQARLAAVEGRVAAIETYLKLDTTNVGGPDQ